MESSVIVHERFSFFWVDSWINLLCRLWTIHLDELEMDYFLLLHQLPLCSRVVQDIVVILTKFHFFVHHVL